MYFLDSWVWLEVYLEDEKWKKAQQIIDKLKENKGIIDALVILEVKYRITRMYTENKSERVIRNIRSIENLEVLPVTSEVAIHSSKIRDKYYKRRELELSYGDAVHLSTAILTDCSKFYSGDSDFKEMDEIKTTII